MQLLNYYTSIQWLVRGSYSTKNVAVKRKKKRRFWPLILSTIVVAPTI